MQNHKKFTDIQRDISYSIMKKLKKKCFLETMQFYSQTNDNA